MILAPGCEINSENSFFVRLGWDECRHSLPRGPVAQWMRHRPTQPGIVGLSPTRITLIFDSVTVKKPHVLQCSQKKFALLRCSVPPRCVCPSENNCGGGPWRISQSSKVKCVRKMLLGRHLGEMARRQLRKRQLRKRKVKGAFKAEFCPLKGAFATYNITTAFSKVPSKKFSR